MRLQQVLFYFKGTSYGWEGGSSIFWTFFFSFDSSPHSNSNIPVIGVVPFSRTLRFDHWARGQREGFEQSQIKQQS